MEKVKIKLPKEVASSMKFFIDDCQYSKYAMMRIFLNGSKSDHCIDGACLENYAVENYEVLLQALVNGYEVEETPLTISITSNQIETFRRDYETVKRLSKDDIRFDWKLQGMEKTIELFNIKIEGIN